MQYLYLKDRQELIKFLLKVPLNHLLETIKWCRCAPRSEYQDLDDKIRKKNDFFPCNDHPDRWLAEGVGGSLLNVAQEAVSLIQKFHRLLELKLCSFRHHLDEKPALYLYHLLRYLHIDIIIHFLKDFNCLNRCFPFFILYFLFNFFYNYILLLLFFLYILFFLCYLYNVKKKKIFFFLKL